MMFVNKKVFEIVLFMGDSANYEFSAAIRFIRDYHRLLAYIDKWQIGKRLMTYGFHEKTLQKSLSVYSFTNDELPAY